MCCCSSRTRRRSTAQAGTWFDDPEIYEWFAANLHRVREPSMRHYVRARELKAAGMDWTEVLAAEDENKRERLAAELLASAAHASTAERVKAFVEQGEGAGRRFSITGGRLQGERPGDARLLVPQPTPARVGRQLCWFCPFPLPKILLRDVIATAGSKTGPPTQRPMVPRGLL